MAALGACDGATGPVPAIPARDLAATVLVSPSTLSLAAPPDSLIVRIRVQNTRPYRVRIAPDSSRGTTDEPFIGFGVRWRVELIRTDGPGSGGAADYMTWEEIQLRSYGWADLTHVIRPVGGAWSGWGGEYAVHASLQGEALPAATLRVVP